MTVFHNNVFTTNIRCKPFPTNDYIVLPSTILEKKPVAYSLLKKTFVRYLQTRNRADVIMTS